MAAQPARLNAEHATGPPVVRAMENKPQDTPSEVEAEAGEVLVDGPDGIALSFTPDAASRTSDRLMFGAAKARGQQLARERKSKRASG